MNSFIMPAGHYYIGDLCYVISSRWDQVVDLMFPTMSGSGIQGKHTLDDDTVFCTFSTAYGDGEYTDGAGKQYLVDSGGIGCVLTTCIDSENTMDGGNVHFFDQPFECFSDGRVLYFGNVVIDTAGQPDFDEDDDDEYDEGEDD